jgi:hypothetical protein
VRFRYDLVHHTDSDFMADILRSGYLTRRRRTGTRVSHGMRCFPYVYVSCYDKPENIRYLFSRVCVSLEVLCDRTFVNKRFVCGWLGRLSILSAIRVLVL